MCVCTSVAQDYAIDKIPKELKKGANAVIRTWDTEFHIENEEMSVYREKKAISILNEDGEAWGQFVEFYDKLDKIKKIKITLYDAEGKVAKRVKSSEIEDVNITSSGSLYDSNRLKGYIATDIKLPYTIEIEFEKVKTSSLHYPVWGLRRAPNLAVEAGKLMVYSPPAYQIRYKEKNYEGEVIIKTDDTGTTYQWGVANLPAIEQEYLGSSVFDMSPHVLLAPTSFSMEGFSGRMDTWQGFGQWINKLNNGREQLPAELEGKLKALVANALNDKEKIRLIYEYLQSNTRYVSIQLGIGGYQPFEAADVAKTGYGDCKALTYFTYSMLKSVGIKSNYTLVLAGEDEGDIITDFPSSQFNHVILSVPMEKDTVWLECTSQDAPFNFLGGFTSDRHALMITEDGGKLIKTPSYPMEVNTQTRVGEVTFDKEGNGQASIETVYKGRRYDDYAMVVKAGKEDQRKHLLNSIDIPAFDLGDFSFEHEKSENPMLKQTLSIGLRKYASQSGERLFFVPNLLTRQEYIPPKMEDRESPIVLKYAYVNTDTIKFKIPESYRLEFQPEPVIHKSEFGEYNVSYQFDVETNELTYIRSIQMKKGTYSAESYNDYRDFRREISRADRSKLVLIGST
ncbi:hypothetical protein MB14_02860 [Roseivirga ehrenbergii]|uniref:DUF3857 domain-containing protein n=1 Tax=Roseivirga ehrenbergii (strain DSM 102268 / JCM 13514 / KCTC 12282 / NCIMB 14502 / KMM 6017) TaxID=279360 RepID=A0A150XC05_ROSEK|nr:hypothetical protein MB14_02860 [Roseivirga ehrenbergii]